MDLNTVSVNVPIFIKDENIKYENGEVVNATIITAITELKVLKNVEVNIVKYAAFDSIYIATFTIGKDKLDEFHITNISYFILYSDESNMDRNKLIVISPPNEDELMKLIDREEYPFLIKKEAIIPFILDTPVKAHHDNEFKMICRYNDDELLEPTKYLRFDSALIGNVQYSKIHSFDIFLDEDGFWKCKFFTEYFADIEKKGLVLKLSSYAYHMNNGDTLIIVDKAFSIVKFDHNYETYARTPKMQHFSLRLMGNLRNVFYKYANTEKRVKATIIESLENPVVLFDDEVIFTKLNFENEGSHCYVYFEITETNVEKYNITEDCWFIFSPPIDEDDESINLILRRPNQKYIGEEVRKEHFYKIPLTLDTYDPKKVIRIEIPRRDGNFILESNKEINLDLPVNYEYKPDQVLNKDNIVNCFKDEEDGLWYITFTSEIEGLDKYVARGYYNGANSKKLENGDIIYYPAYTRFFLMEKKEESKPVISNKTKKREDYISWEEYFMSIAKLSARRSKDPNTQVGCCIEKDKKILSMGYNGFPNGCSDDEFPWDAENEDPMNVKDHYVVHAEINAILNYPGSASHLHGSTIWVTLFPCNECTKAIIQAGIKRVVYLEYKEGLKTETSKRMMDAAGVEYYSFDEISLAKIGNVAVKQMDEIKPFGIKELGKLWEGISFSDKKNGIIATIKSFESALYNPDFSKLVPNGITEEEYEYFLKTAIEIMKGKKVADKDFIIFCIKIMEHDESTPEQYKTNFIEILNQKVQIMEMMEKRQNELEEENKVEEKRKYDTVQIGMFYKDNQENTCFFVDEVSISKHRKEISIYTITLSTEHDTFYELVKNKIGYFIFPSVYIKYNSNIFENMYPIIGLDSKEYIDADILDDRLHSGRIEMLDDISYNENHGEILRTFKTYRDQYEKCTALKVSTTMKINEEEPGLS